MRSSTSKRGDLLSLGLARLFRLAPASHQRRPFGDGRRARRTRAASWCRNAAAPRACRPISIVAEAGAAAPRRHARYPRAAALGRTFGAARARRDLPAHQAAHRTTLVFVNTRSQAESIFQQLWQINDDNLAIALHHGSLDVAQRRKVEAAMAGRPAARGGLHLLARSRRRLGRCRSRRQCRRAEGRVAIAAADRPRQSPHGRAVEGRARPGQSLRSAGMPRRARRHRRERAGHAGRCASARSTYSRSTCSAAPAASRFAATNFMPKCTTAAPYAALDARRFRRRGRFRRHRRLCAQGL